jgi:hypothetical protein
LFHGLPGSSGGWAAGALKSSEYSTGFTGERRQNGESAESSIDQIDDRIARSRYQ